MENPVDDVFARLDTDATPERVAEELARQWELIRSDPATREALRRQGIDLSPVDDLATCPFDAKPPQATPGFERESGNRADMATAILIGIGVKLGSDIGAAALRELWRRVLKRHIEEMFGPVGEPPRRDPPSAG